MQGNFEENKFVMNSNVLKMNRNVNQTLKSIIVLWEMPKSKLNKIKKIFCTVKVDHEVKRKFTSISSAMLKVLKFTKKILHLLENGIRCPFAGRLRLRTTRCQPP